ncbi:MAG: tetratricopeptide repeat protein [Vicinamibacterales bacterium]|nr:tetratricopeptide repeat protein [Vicinamibacterales bacterium]
MAHLALIAGLGIALAGCGKINEVRAMKAFKDGNKAYATSNWNGAVDRYEEAIRLDPNNSQIHFYLGNAYDNLYRPARAGDASNDAFLEKAIEHYKLAADQLGDNPSLQRLSLEYLVAAYGPNKLNDPTLAEPVVIKMIEIEPNEPSNYFALAKIYEDSGEYELAEETFTRARDARPNDPTVYMQLAGYYNRQGEFDRTIEALGQRVAIEPNNPEAHYTVATYYWDKAFRDFRLQDAEKMDLVLRGIESVDKAIAIRDDYMEAIAYKNLLLRLQANLERNPARQQALLKEADTLRDRATELRKQKAAGEGN